MSLAIVVVIVSRNTAGREMHQRTVNGAQRTDSSEWGFFFCRDKDPKEAKPNTRRRRGTVPAKPLSRRQNNVLILCVFLCRTSHRSRRCFFFFGWEITVFLVLRQPWSGRRIPALGADYSPMNVSAPGHTAATRWPTVQTRGECTVHCVIFLETPLTHFFLFYQPDCGPLAVTLRCLL